MEVIVLVFVLGLYFSPALAQPGSLDPTFGNGGIVSDDAYAFEAIAIQPDGKIVVASFVGEYPDFDIGVFRYNSDGSRDTTFDGDGKVTTDIGARDAGHAVALQPDGKILVGANSVIDSEGQRSSKFVVVRYRSDGSLDTTFDGDGKVLTYIGGQDAAHSIAVQPDGKILVAGRAQGPDWLQLFVVVRYNSNGSLDSSFGDHGKVTTDFNGQYDVANSVALQPDGKIVVSGTGEGLFTVVRYNSEGLLDTSFDDDGKVTTGSGVANSVAVQPDGKIIAGGSSTSNLVLRRYNSNGSLDTTFANNGTATISLQGAAVATSVVLRPDSKIVVAGTASWNSGFFDNSLVAARYNSNGSLDKTFGDDGIVTIGSNDPKENYYSGNGVAVDSRGRIVIGGMVAYHAAVYRLLGQFRKSAFDFDGDGRSDVSVFRPSDSVWYLNRSTEGFFARQFGISTDKIVPADYDGDGKTDVAVYRDATWWRINSSDLTVSAQSFGIAGDVPVPADYTGDGQDDLAVYRNGQWWALDLSNNQSSLINFGLASDKPAPADYDGDGRVDQAVYRNGEWHINRSSLGYTVGTFGLSSDRPVVGDYDGDGRADLAVYRDGTWYLQQSTAGFGAFQWGLPTDVPAPADYDGDGKTDAAVFRNGVWYLRQTTSGVSIQQFGLPGDEPVESAFIAQ
jgi:uncharacterized delta-60 repeat protein